MRLLCLSDLHGNLPKKLPICDLMVIAGDICPDFTDHHRQIEWLDTEFRPFLEYNPLAFITWGNHDFGPEKFPLETASLNLPCEILIDRGIKRDGYYFWGSPWTHGLPRWAWQLTPERLSADFESLSPSIDVLISHSPPYMFGDQIVRGDHVGSCGLKRYIETRDSATPLLNVFGHIHEAKGLYLLPNTLLVNASYVDEYYRPTNRMEVVTI